jgi:hypothetical protein
MRKPCKKRIPRFWLGATAALLVAVKALFGSIAISGTTPERTFRRQFARNFLRSPLARPVEQVFCTVLVLALYRGTAASPWRRPAGFDAVCVGAMSGGLMGPDLGVAAQGSFIVSIKNGLLLGIC